MSRVLALVACAVSIYSAFTSYGARTAEEKAISDFAAANQATVNRVANLQAQMRKSADAAQVEVSELRTEIDSQAKANEAAKTQTMATIKASRVELQEKAKTMIAQVQTENLRRVSDIRADVGSVGQKLQQTGSDVKQVDSRVSRLAFGAREK